MNAFKCDKGRQLQIEECIFESMVEPKDKRAELNTKTTFRAEENGVEVTKMNWMFAPILLNRRIRNRTYGGVRGR